MGGFLSTLGEIGKGIGQHVLSNIESKNSRSPLGGSIYQAIRNRQNAQNWQNLQSPASPGSVSAPGTWMPSQDPTVTGIPPSGGPPDATQMALGEGPNPWLAGEAMAAGQIVTKPTFARIGEHGPEAVVPLTPRAGNHLQPDILEGHVSGPKVPGVRYSRYRGFNRLAPGVGGELG